MLSNGFWRTVLPFKCSMNIACFPTPPSQCVDEPCSGKRRLFTDFQVENQWRNCNQCTSTERVGPALWISKTVYGVWTVVLVSKFTDTNTTVQSSLYIKQVIHFPHLITNSSIKPKTLIKNVKLKFYENWKTCSFILDKTAKRW